MFGALDGPTKKLAWMFRCLFMKSVFDGMGCPAVWNLENYFLWDPVFLKGPVYTFYPSKLPYRKCFLRDPKYPNW